MKKRGLILLTFLLVSYLSVGWLRSGAGASGTAPPVDLSVVPSEIGNWVGDDLEIDDETVVVMGADSFLNRVYSTPAGQQVAFHVATWKNTDTVNPAPHHPQTCYAGGGWTLLDRRTVQVPGPDGTVPMELILFEKEGARVVTGHWFRVGAASFVSADGFREYRRQFWGLRYWPNSTKVLLQTRALTLDAAEPTLVEFASLLNGVLTSRDTIVEEAVASESGT